MLRLIDYTEQQELREIIDKTQCPRRGHSAADRSVPLFHSDAEPIALVEDFNDLAEGQFAAGTQADMNWHAS